MASIKKRGYYIATEIFPHTRTTRAADSDLLLVAQGERDSFTIKKNKSNQIDAEKERRPQGVKCIGQALEIRAKSNTVRNHGEKGGTRKRDPGKKRSPGMLYGRSKMGEVPNPPRTTARRRSRGRRSNIIGGGSP